VEKRVEVVRRDWASRAGESDRVSWKESGLGNKIGNRMTMYLKEIATPLIPHALPQLGPVAETRPAYFERGIQNRQGG